MNNVAVGMLGVVVACAGAGVAGAAISSVAGAVVQIAPPVVADFPTLTGPKADAWDEQQGVLISGGVQVDMLVNGGFMTSTAATGGVVTGLVDSHFLHQSLYLIPLQGSGTITFSAAIEGVIFSDALLDLSDASLGWGGTAYPTTQIGRGINSAGVITASGNVLSFSFMTANPAGEIDQVRVLTRAVPAPGGVCVAALGLASGLRRRRR